MSVSIVTCVYGDYGHFIPGWFQSIRNLHFDDLIVATDRHHDIPEATIIVTDCPWKYPQAFYLQRAFEECSTDWVWKLDIDDRALPTALDGIEDVDADVWVLGYENAAGAYLPPRLSNMDYLASGANPYTSCSAIRLQAFRDCRGFQDVFIEDWTLWRRLARNNAVFEASTRPHYMLSQGSYSRDAQEHATGLRNQHLLEMREAECR